MRYAVVHEDGSVVNTIELEDGAEWSLPDCCQIVQSDEAGLGWTYANGVFTEPSVVGVPFVTLSPTPSVNEVILAQIADLEATMTPRRIREAIKDPSWMEELETKIAALRAQLTEE